jgi:hypothetical protein
MTNLEELKYNGDFTVQDVVEAFNQDWEEQLSNFIYDNPIDIGTTEAHQFLALAKSVINISNDYRRVANLLNNK